MLIITKKGRYKLDSNYRDAFQLEAFESKYIEECFDRYTYIVGDISSGILRLKGFDTNPQSKNYYGFIDDYLTVSCALGCPYYILKRIQSDGEFQKEQNKRSEVKSEGFSIQPIVKESFDKENILLESSGKEKPNIKIDSEKINAIPKGELTPDLKEFVKQEKSNNSSTKAQAVAKQEDTQTYVSASPDFDPSKSSANRFNRGNHNNNNNNNKNRNHNKNKNKKNNNKQG